MDIRPPPTLVSTGCQANSDIEQSGLLHRDESYFQRAGLRRYDVLSFPGQQCTSRRVSP